MTKFFDRILFGGDYNPNQWPKEIWEEDIRIFKKQVSIARPSMFFHGQRSNPLKIVMILRNWIKSSKN